MYAVIDIYDESYWMMNYSTNALSLEYNVYLVWDLKIQCQLLG